MVRGMPLLVAALALGQVAGTAFGADVSLSLDALTRNRPDVGGASLVVTVVDENLQPVRFRADAVDIRMGNERVEGPYVVRDVSESVARQRVAFLYLREVLEDTGEGAPAAEFLGPVRDGIGKLGGRAEVGFQCEGVQTTLPIAGAVVRDAASIKRFVADDCSRPQAGGAVPSIERALDELRSESDNGNSALVVFGARSLTAAGAVRAYFKQEEPRLIADGIRVFPVILGHNAADAQIAAVARSTGGIAFASGSEEPAAFLERIIDLIAAQQVVDMPKLTNDAPRTTHFEVVIKTEIGTAEGRRAFFVPALGASPSGVLWALLLVAVAVVGVTGYLTYRTLTGRAGAPGNPAPGTTVQCGHCRMTRSSRERECPACAQSLHVEARLFVSSPASLAGLVLHVVPGDNAVGRDAGDGVGLLLPDATVSAVHAVVKAPGQGIFKVIDQGSTNGTFLNEQPLPPRSAAPISVNDVIRFGAVECRLVLGRDVAGRSGRTVRMNSRTPLPGGTGP